MRLTLSREAIEAACRKCPADQALREVLKRCRTATSQLKREVATTVHTYYRWLGWLDEPASLEDRLKQE